MNEFERESKKFIFLFFILFSFKYPRQISLDKFYVTISRISSVRQYSNEWEEKNKTFISPFNKSILLGRSMRDSSVKEERKGRKW